MINSLYAVLDPGSAGLGGSHLGKQGYRGMTMHLRLP